MFYVKSKSKRKNVITSLAIVLALGIGMMLDINQPVQQNEPNGINVVEAGRFWGRDVNKRGKRVYRIFWIGINRDKDRKPLCPTYG